MDNKGFYISFKVDGGVYVSAKNEETARKFFEREFSVSNSVLLGFDSKLSYPEINAAVIDSITECETSAEDHCCPDTEE